MQICEKYMIHRRNDRCGNMEHSSVQDEGKPFCKEKADAV